MSDKTDPRRYRCCGHCQSSPNGGCGDMWGEPKHSHQVACPHGCNDSLPPGVVRVDTRDEALVERLEGVIHEAWDTARVERFDAAARAVLDDLRGSQ